MTNEELPTPTRHRGTARAYVVAFAGCAAMIVGALVAFVAIVALPDNSGVRAVAGGVASWIAAGGVAITAAAMLFILARLFWTLVRAARAS